MLQLVLTPLRLVGLGRHTDTLGTGCRMRSAGRSAVHQAEAAIKIINDSPPSPANSGNVTPFTRVIIYDYYKKGDGSTVATVDGAVGERIRLRVRMRIF